MKEKAIKLAIKECTVKEIDIKNNYFDINKFLTKLDDIVNTFLAACMLFGMCWISACADNGNINDMIPGFISLSFIGMDMILSKLLYTKCGKKFVNMIKIKIRKGR